MISDFELDNSSILRSSPHFGILAFIEPICFVDNKYTVIGINNHIYTALEISFKKFQVDIHHLHYAIKIGHCFDMMVKENLQLKVELETSEKSLID